MKQTFHIFSTYARLFVLARLANDKIKPSVDAGTPCCFKTKKLGQAKTVAVEKSMHPHRPLRGSELRFPKQVITWSFSLFTHLEYLRRADKHEEETRANHTSFEGRDHGTKQDKAWSPLHPSLTNVAALLGVSVSHFGPLPIETNMGTFTGARGSFFKGSTDGH